MDAKFGSEKGMRRGHPELRIMVPSCRIDSSLGHLNPGQIQSIDAPAEGKIQLEIVESKTHSSRIAENFGLDVSDYALDGGIFNDWLDSGGLNELQFSITPIIEPVIPDQVDAMRERAECPTE